MTAYELLRDITLIELAVIALLAAIIGVLSFYILKATLTTDITKTIHKLVDKECMKIQARSNIHAGVNHWIGKMYDRAFRLTQMGIEQGSSLLEESEIIMAKSNCGYYLAEQHQISSSIHLKNKAIKYVKEGYEKYDQFKVGYHRPDWIDNYIFVKARFCTDRAEKTELLTLIEQLIVRDDLKDIRYDLNESKNYLVGLNI